MMLRSIGAPLVRRSAYALCKRSNSTSNSFWQWTTTQRASFKESKKEAAIAFVVFGITGTLSMVAVRPALKSVFGLEGSLAEGPNSYRIMSILCVSPFYAAILLAIGTLSGRHNTFAKMSMQIFGRFVPKSVVHRVMCQPARAKQLPK